MMKKTLLLLSAMTIGICGSKAQLNLTTSDFPAAGVSYTLYEAGWDMVLSITDSISEGVGGAGDIYDISKAPYFVEDTFNVGIFAASSSTWSANHPTADMFMLDEVLTDSIGGTMGYLYSFMETTPSGVLVEGYTALIDTGSLFSNNPAGVFDTSHTMADVMDTVISTDYTYGFQGQEKDDEVKGNGNHINFKYRGYDPRVGRFWSIDPLARKYPFYSPYAFSGNRVIDRVELEGLEPAKSNVFIDRTFNTTTNKQIELQVRRIEDIPQPEGTEEFTENRIILKTTFVGADVLKEQTRVFFVPVSEEGGSNEPETPETGEPDFDLEGVIMLPVVDVEDIRETGAKDAIENVLPGVTTEKVVDLIDEFIKVEKKPPSDTPEP
jgi:RHS repeat-associated protein